MSSTKLSKVTELTNQQAHSECLAHCHPPDADTMIDTAVELKGIQDAEDGFLMVFSAGPFPDADFDLDWVREDGGGNVYRGRFEVDGEAKEMEGWLCPALNLYYPDAPAKLYVQVREAK